MLSLLEFQRGVAASILGRGAEEDHVDGEAEAHTGTQAYQETILLTVLRALELSFPSVVLLTGPDEFKRIARGYFRVHPPRSALMCRYGEDFPDHLRLHTGSLPYPYLYDLARFDWHIDRASQETAGAFSSPLLVAPRVRVRLPLSLRCPRFEYPIAHIRDALRGGRRNDLTTAELNSRARWFAIWRGIEGACVEPVSEAAAIFLSHFIESAAGDASPQAVLTSFSAEIVSCSFARAATPSDRTSPPAP